MTQCDRVLDFMTNGNGTITTLDAFTKLGITRLSGRIHDLRAKGYGIETVMTDVPNRYGEKCRVGVYVLNSLPEGTVIR